ncbi:MAG TPA: diguanylate cyclase, partial [Arenimonas sp.]|nr:diguanylate cyclase [Arenimonas sp.]
MILRRFQSRIIALLIAVVASAQLATLAVVQVATERSVAAQLQRDLEVGQRVWQRFFESRSSQLIESSAVLADDFGFKAAVASGDPRTMRSALDNHGSRIGAGATVLLSPDGEWLSGSDALASGGRADALRPLFKEASEQGSALSLLVIDGRLYLMVLLPVLAPHPLAWVGIGIAFDDEQARDFQGLTGLEANFVRSRAETLDLFGSSLAVSLQPTLAELPADVGERPVAVTLADAHFLAQREPLLAADGDSIDLLLLASVDQAMLPFAELRQRILWLAGIASVIALGIAVLLGRGISRPVSGLAAAVRRVQGGDYSKPVEVRGHDEIAQLAGAFSDMQQGIAAREARIVHQASHDGLTGLPNRSLAVRRLQQALSRPLPDDQRVVVALLDIERFKEINDKFGHRFGDEVLLELSRRLQHAVRADDTVARLGADEFMVLLAGVERGQVQRRADALLAQLRQPLQLSMARISLDAGIGLALAPEHGDDPETLLRRADIALYEAKQKQIGIAVYQPGRDEQHLRQLTLMTDLRLSIERRELSLRFQPKVDVSSRRAVHVEALLRWTHGELGPVGPDEFIPLAERSGFVHEL